jgi:PAS domain S-box-containing protein
MAGKQVNARENSGRKNKKRLATHRITALAARSRSRGSIESAMKRTKATAAAGRRAFTGGVGGANNRKGATEKPVRRPLFRQPRTELEQAIQRYVDLFDFAPIGYVTFDRVGCIEEINLAAVRLVRGSRSQLLGTSFAICVAKEDIHLFLDHLRQCRSPETPVVTELRLQRLDGAKKDIPVLLSSTGTFASMKDGARLYQTAIVDLTERKRAEQTLLENQQRLWATYERAPIGISECSAQGKYIRANEEFCRLLGYTKDEIAQRDIKDVTHKEDWPGESKLYGQLVAGEIPFYRIEKRFVRKNRAIIWAEMLWSIVRDSKEGSLYAIGTVRDITQAKKAEAALQKSKELLEQRVRERTRELRAANKELKSEIERRKGMEGEILAISDREQQRLGQELHDGLCQHLTAVAFMARSVALRLRNHRVIDAADIEKIAELVNAAAADTRTLSLALHRSDVDAAGLVSALQDLVDREIWRTPCRLEVRPSFRIDDDVAAAHLYRIAREAVINANKHAQARQILVKLERSRQGMVMRVTDDGVGFSTEPKLKQGLGFHIMNYRAQLMGGRLEIDSPKRGGTCVSCYLPDGAPRSRKAQSGETGSQGDSPRNQQWRQPPGNLNS